MLIFHRKSIHWKSLLLYAKNDAKEWKQVGGGNGYGMLISTPSTFSRGKHHWKRPSPGWIKCNADGAFANNLLPSQAGWVYI